MRIKEDCGHGSEDGKVHSEQGEKEAVPLKRVRVPESSEMGVGDAMPPTVELGIAGFGNGWGLRACNLDRQSRNPAKDSQSGQGQMQWKRRARRWQWRAQPRKRGSRKSCGGKKHPHSQPPKFIHELLFGSTQGTGCRLR